MKRNEEYSEAWNKYNDAVAGKTNELWTALDFRARAVQEAINALIDSTKSASMENSASQGIAVRQMLEKKQGAIRQRMMGKRVDYAARTVIAPDAYINTNEIGIPIEFAMKLNLTESVNENNIEYLKALIRNGHYNYPGANAVEIGDRLISLRFNNDEKRAMIADKLELSSPDKANVKVYRHIRDGDIVVMNRQPSLHKPSMMAHFVRVNRGWRTFRFHYVNCGSYNADFDGDEMNMHLPQSFEAQSEARQIANSDCQYNVPKNGDVLRGLIQDHVLGGNFLTIKGSFLTRERYMQLVYNSLGNFADRGQRKWMKSDVGKNSGLGDLFDASQVKSLDPYAAVFAAENIKVVTEPPCILKPVRLWSGKQVITSIIKTVVDFGSHSLFDEVDGFQKVYKGINLTSKSKTAGDAWNGVLDGDKEESTVIIRNSELVQGVFDKNQFGASSYGFVHYCYETLGPRIAGILLGCFGRLGTLFLQMRGFSCCAGDFMMTEDGEAERAKMIERTAVGGVFIQEMFVDAVNQAMKWKEPITNKFPLKAKFEKMYKAMLREQEGCELEDVLQDVSAMKTTNHRISNRGFPVQSDDALKKDLKKGMKYGFLLDADLGKIKRADDTKIEYLDTWDVSRKVHTPDATRNWRLRTPEEIKSIGKKLHEEISKFARESDPSTKENIIRIWASIPEVNLYFPKLAALLGSEKLWGAGQIEHINRMRAQMENLETKSPARFTTSDRTDQFRYPSSNTQVLLPSGNVIHGDGGLRVPLLHPVSWCYQSRTSSLGEDFDDPARYATHLVQVRNQEEAEFLKSGKSSRPFNPLPNELSRLRLELLCKLHFPGREAEFQKMLDGFFQSTMGKITSKNNDLVSGDRTLYKFPGNGFSAMITTGAKGSKVNYAMIAGMLSQQSLEGRRVPVMVSFKTLPSFARFDWGARAGGLITDRYLTGLRPQEYFFHCMAGREGLVDTAVKTANSGYLQRCVMKGLEGMVVGYDGTVRDSDGSIIQFLYGEDAIDPMRSQYLNKFDDLLFTPSLVKAKLGNKDILKKKKIRDNIKIGYICPDNIPAEGLLNPTVSPGIVSEKFFNAVNEFEKKFCEAEIKKGRDKKEAKKEARSARTLMLLKYRDCLMQPGEGVGCLAAQSMGEPATQMTLNTFHLAGHGAANVTLGIPRLKEILQVAGYAGTPVLYIPLRYDETESGLTVEQKASEILKGFRRIPFTDIVHSVGVDASVYMVPPTATREGTEFGVESQASAGEIEKYWSYEVTLQLENLEHFCEVVPKFTPQKLIHYTLAKVVRAWARRVNHNVGLYSLMSSETDILQYQDELDDAFDVVLNRKVRNVYEKKAARKERAKVAGLGFGQVKGREDDGEADLQTNITVDASWLKKGKNDKDNEDETGGTGQAEAAGETSDVASDASEDSFSDKGPDVSDDGLDMEMGDEQEEQKSKVVKVEEDEEELRIQEEKERALIRKVIEGAKLEAESMWFDDAQSKDSYWKLKQLPDEAFRFLKDVKVCRKTWRVVCKFSWPYQRCPQRIDFIPYFVQELKKCKLQDTPGVRNARVVGGDSAEIRKNHLEVVCDGSNFAWAHRLKDSHVDHNNLYSNDIKVLQEFYGIEACRTILIKELAKVFAVYGITVDFRHLSLIGDAMTSTGILRAFNRLGITPHSSPFLQMSFETSMNFMTQALERGAFDDLGSPSSAIVAGSATRLGTGSHRVMVKMGEFT